MAVRYFPVSQDINADSEVWELTDTFGDRSLRVWLECLSIADRNNGVLPGRWERYPSILAGRCKSTTRHLVTVCQWLTRWLVIDSEGVARVRNYPKYHKLRAERSTAPNLPNHSEPYSSKKKNIKTAFPERFEISDDLCKWCLTQHTEANLHIEAFKDYHCSKGSRFIDWNAAFRTWVRNAAKFNRNGNGRQAEGELSERTQRILRRGL